MSEHPLPEWITIDPGAQNRNVSRQLMQAAMKRATEKKFAGVRLVQAAYHNRSLSLYAKLGFVVREPLARMQGSPIQKTPPGYNVRAAQASDIEACNDLCMRVHGHDRGGELKDAVQHDIDDRWALQRTRRRVLVFHSVFVSERGKGMRQGSTSYERWTEGCE